MQQTVLILGGSGKVGQHATDAFWNAGWTVRQYTRGTDMLEAAKGADVIVNGLNPPSYHNWAAEIPSITNQVIAAARASGASVVIPGNIYNFGNQPGLLNLETPQTPQTRKGQIRVTMEQAYRDAGVQTIVLRAGNFIDPQGNGDLFSAVMMRNITKGKLVALGDPDALQAYAYVPDWARAAVALAEKRHALAVFEDIPFPGHTFTANQLLTEVQRALPRPVRLVQFPWWLMTAFGPFWELAREMREMRYLYSMSHRLDSAKFEKLLPGFRATDTLHVMRAGLPRDVHPNQMMRPSGQTIIAE